MKDFSTALDQIFTKVGAAAGIAACWLFFQVQELNNRVEKLENKIETVNEIKQDLSSIKTQLDFIIKYKLEEKEEVNVKRK